MKKLIYIFLTIAILMSALSVMYIRKMENFVNTTMMDGQFTINKGASPTRVYNILTDNLTPPMGLKTYLIKVKKYNAPHYGYYEVVNMPFIELMNMITTGKQTLTKVTFPEGYNMYDVAATLHNAGVADKQEMMNLFTNRQIVEELVGHPYETIEGFLAPGTYLFSKEYPPKLVAKKMVDEFYRTLPADFTAKAKIQGLSFYDAIIVASIVQKETYMEEESPLVAAVFLNRIKKKMLIQADPTIIYGIYPEYDGKIRKVDLQNASNRFNTYRHKGLTPTPISNPSVMALNAVIAPSTTDYIFFVAMQDGTHVFAVTYEDHKRNVRIHQLGLSR